MSRVLKAAAAFTTLIYVVRLQHRLHIFQQQVGSLDRRLRAHRAEPHAAFLIKQGLLDHELPVSAYETFSDVGGISQRYSGLDVYMPPLSPENVVRNVIM